MCVFYECFHGWLIYDKMCLLVREAKAKAEYFVFSLCQRYITMYNVFYAFIMYLCVYLCKTMSGGILC